jgi:hypothetical protein
MHYTLPSSKPVHAVDPDAHTAAWLEHVIQLHVPCGPLCTRFPQHGVHTRAIAAGPEVCQVTSSVSASSRNAVSEIPSASSRSSASTSASQSVCVPPVTDHCNLTVQLLSASAAESQSNTQSHSEGAGEPSQSASGVETDGVSSSVLSASATDASRATSAQNCLCGNQLATLYIQMQLCEYSLHDWLITRDTSPAMLHAEAIHVFHQVVTGVHYIHSMKLIHRDIKVTFFFV